MNEPQMPHAIPGFFRLPPVCRASDCPGPVDITVLLDQVQQFGCGRRCVPEVPCAIAQELLDANKGCAA